MDEAGVRLGLCCAWWGPQGPVLLLASPELDNQAKGDRLRGGSLAGFVRRVQILAIRDALSDHRGYFESGAEV